MKGLLLKDLYTIKGFGKQYILVFGFMILWSVCMKSTSFASMYAILLGGMLVLTSMSVDETAHFNQFALTMPINTETVAKAKYLLLVLTIVAGMIIGCVANFIGELIPGFGEGFDVNSIFVIGSLFLLAYTITLPIIYKKGVEKARYAYILVLLALGVTIVGVIKLASMIMGVKMTELPSPTGSSWMLIVGLIIIDLISLFISYRVSLKILSTKEW